MKTTIVVDKYAKLPKDCELWAYDHHTLMLVGPRMTRDIYNKVRASLPSRLGSNLIGWKRIAVQSTRGGIGG